MKKACHWGKREKKPIPKKESAFKTFI